MEKLGRFLLLSFSGVLLSASALSADEATEKAIRKIAESHCKKSDSIATIKNEGFVSRELQSVLKGCSFIDSASSVCLKAIQMNKSIQWGDSCLEELAQSVAPSNGCVDVKAIGKEEIVSGDLRPETKPFESCAYRMSCNKRVAFLSHTLRNGDQTKKVNYPKAEVVGSNVGTYRLLLVCNNHYTGNKKCEGIFERDCSDVEHFEVEHSKALRKEGAGESAPK